MLVATAIPHFIQNQLNSHSYIFFSSFYTLKSSANLVRSANMNNIADQFPFLQATAPEIFAQIASPSRLSPNPRHLFSPTLADNQSPNLRASSSLTPKLRIKKPEYGGSGGGKVARECSECGKKFLSWKALFGHMRCHPERQWRGMNPPTNFRTAGAIPLPPTLPKPEFNPWLTMTEEDYEVAECLMMLANSAPANSPTRPEPDPDHVVEAVGEVGLAGRFECSSCKKVFGSHQALGGHRASHKNVKGCFALMSSSSGGSNTELREVCGDQSAPSSSTRMVMNSIDATDVSGTNLNLDLRLGL